MKILVFYFVLINNKCLESCLDTLYRCEVYTFIKLAKLCLTLVTARTVATQAPLATGHPRQEYWSGLPFPSPGGLPDPEIELWSLALQADSLPTEPPRKPLHNT